MEQAHHWEGTGRGWQLNTDGDSLTFKPDGFPANMTFPNLIAAPVPMLWKRKALLNVSQCYLCSLNYLQLIRAACYPTSHYCSLIFRSVGVPQVTFCPGTGHPTFQQVGCM